MVTGEQHNTTHPHTASTASTKIHDNLRSQERNAIPGITIGMVSTATKTGPPTRSKSRNRTMTVRHRSLGQMGHVRAPGESQGWPAVSTSSPIPTFPFLAIFVLFRFVSFCFVLLLLFVVVCCCCWWFVCCWVVFAWWYPTCENLACLNSDCFATITWSAQLCWWRRRGPWPRKPTGRLVQLLLGLGWKGAFDCILGVLWHEEQPLCYLLSCLCVKSCVSVLFPVAGNFHVNFSLLNDNVVTDDVAVEDLASYFTFEKVGLFLWRTFLWGNSS